MVGARPWGAAAAIGATYGVSALLHGLNFQLGAVLLSLGFYTYVEHGTRHKLAAAFNASIAARRCPDADCSYRYKVYFFSFDGLVHATVYQLRLQECPAFLNVEKSRFL